jgi:hypothetical protein
VGVGNGVLPSSWSAYLPWRRTGRLDGDNAPSASMPRRGRPVYTCRPAVRSADASFRTAPWPSVGAEENAARASRSTQARHRSGDRSGRLRGADPSAVNDDAGADHV